MNLNKSAYVQKALTAGEGLSILLEMNNVQFQVFSFLTRHYGR